MLVGVQVRLVGVGVVPVMGRGVPVVVLLVFEVLEELLVLRVLGSASCAGWFRPDLRCCGLGPPGCSASGVEASEDRLVHPVGVLGGIVAAVCVLLPARRLVPFSPQLSSSVCRPSLVLVPPSISGKS